MSELEQEKLFEEAMERIGRTPDGVVLYKFLQKMLLAVEKLPAGLDDKNGALREIQGKRLLARQMREALSPGVLKADAKIDERPIIFDRAKPVQLVDDANRGAGRRGGQHPATIPDYYRTE